MSAPIRCASEREGQIERITLDRPKGNVLDLEMITALTERVGELAGALAGETERALKLVVFEGAGDHFSFGASVDEHRPEKVGEMLPAFHRLFVEIEGLGVPTAALVRGQCLGGGMELAVWCGRVVCEPTARFGVPEVTLAVFPPIAALALPWRVGGRRATEMIVTGETVDGPAAASRGLADACVEDAESDLGAWFDKALAPKSAVGLRYA